MNSQATSSPSKSISREPIPLSKRIYFQERLKGCVHQLIYDLFSEQEREGKITRSELAHRTGKRPEQITRLLNVSGNLRLETVSDLLLAMDVEPCVSTRELKSMQRNFIGPDWLCDNPAPTPAATNWVVHISGNTVNPAAQTSTVNKVYKLKPRESAECHSR